ncbi:MAG: cytochrome c [Acidobacteriota bacterium]|nr:cytochrome c [Acidobacteriota bacterium]
MNVAVVIGIVAGMGLLRIMRAGLLVWIFAWWLAIWAAISWGFASPVPASAKTMYMAIATISLLAYVASSRERTDAVVRPLLRLVVERKYTPVLALVALAIPAGVAFNVYRGMNVPVEPPFFARTVHPSPPPNIDVHGADIELRGDGPFRKLKDSDPEAYSEHVEGGREVYYENCFYCHGDGMAGDGLFAYGLNPIPTNFTDIGVLPNFQESFFFWRVVKGGPGMPDEGAPGDSAMPKWESFLTEQEMWEVVLFLYDFNGYDPRPLEEHH